LDVSHRQNLLFINVTIPLFVGQGNFEIRHIKRSA